MSEQTKTPRTFEFLLNAMDYASGQNNPAEHGYKDKREAVTNYVSQLESSNAELVAALGKIMWVKDCGVDATDEAGIFRNHPDVERDAMYEIARASLAKHSPESGEASEKISL